MIATIDIGSGQARAKDVLGRVYEYFLGKFAAAEGKLGGEFYTPRSVVRLLVEMIEPYKGRVYDPCCGSGGMFVQSEKFVEAHGGTRGDISIFGQESNPTTWRLAQMNLAIRGIEANLGDSQPTASTTTAPDLKADYILANPPFNVSRLVRRPLCGTTCAGDTASRRSATPTSPGSSISSTTLLPRRERGWCRGLRHGQWIAVVRRRGRRRNRQEDHRGRPGRLHSRHAPAALPDHGDTSVAVVHQP